MLLFVLNFVPFVSPPISSLQFADDEEQIKTWEFRSILELSKESLSSSSRSTPFYPLHEFKLWERDSIHFPGFLGASSNFYDLNWSGERRIKNVGMVLDVMPNATNFEEDHSLLLAQLPDDVDKGLRGLVEGSRDSLAHLARGDKISLEELVKATLGLFESQDEESVGNGWLPSEEQVQDAVKLALSNIASSANSYDGLCLQNILDTKALNHVHDGRFFLCLCLAEAETIRRIMHLREGLGSDEYVIDGGNGIFMALRSMYNMHDVVDQSDHYKPPPPFQLQISSCLLRFFDGDVWFNYRELWLLVSALTLDRTHERKVFFQNLVERKRRAQLEWKQTPIQAAFDFQTCFMLSFPLSTRVMLGRAIAQTGIHDLKMTFNRFDADGNETLEPAELLDLFNSLGFKDFSARELISFFQYADKDGDNKISLSEFMECIHVFHQRYAYSSVRLVDERSFESKVRNAGHFVFLYAHASYCDSCKTLAPIWEDLGKAFEASASKKEVVIAKVDVSAKVSKLRTDLNLKKLPTLLLFKGDGSSPETYDGARDFESLCAFVTKKTSAIAMVLHSEVKAEATSNSVSKLNKDGRQISSYVIITTADEMTKKAIDTEQTLLLQEDREREAAAASLLKEQQERVRKVSSCSAAETVSDAEDPKEANPSISTKRVKWDFTEGPRKYCWMSTACDYHLDSDAKCTRPVRQNYFMRPDIGARIKFMLPTEFSKTSGEEKDTEIDKTIQGGEQESGFDVYSLSMCVRFQNPENSDHLTASMPLFSLNDEIVVMVWESGEVSLLKTDESNERSDDKFFQSNDADEDEVDRPLIIPGEWSAVTITADVQARTLKIYLDGSFLGQYEDVQGLTSLKSTPETPWYVLSTKKPTTAKCAMTADVRFVCLDLDLLTITGCENSSCSILELHVPVGVWQCSACPEKERNGVGYTHCRRCKAEKKPSAPRPPGDKDPEHPGLTIVVSESFEDIVLDVNKNVFLDVSADWCGPSVQMKPEWHALAHLLKDRDDILIAYMDSDSNDQDRYYLSETSIPNLKLFPKDNKDNFIGFPSGTARNVKEFIAFLQQHAGLDIQKFAEQKWPQYEKDHEIQRLQSKAQAALAAVMDKSSSSLSVFVDRFVAQYFMSPHVFEFDDALRDKMLGGEYESSNYSSENATMMMKRVVEVIRECLLNSLPEDPEQYLATALQRTPVCGTAKVGKTFRMSKSTWLALFNKAKNAIRRHGSGKTLAAFSMCSQSEFSARDFSDRCAGVTKTTAELERILDSEKLPPTAYENDDSLICLAASYGDVDSITALFDRGGNLNESQPQGKTSLRYVNVLSTCERDFAILSSERIHKCTCLLV